MSCVSGPYPMGRCLICGVRLEWCRCGNVSAVSARSVKFSFSLDVAKVWAWFSGYAW